MLLDSSILDLFPDEQKLACGALWPDLAVQQGCTVPSPTDRFYTAEG